MHCPKHKQIYTVPKIDRYTLSQKKSDSPYKTEHFTVGADWLQDLHGLSAHQGPVCGRVVRRAGQARCQTMSPLTRIAGYPMEALWMTRVRRATSVGRQLMPSMRMLLQLFLTSMVFVVAVAVEFGVALRGPWTLIPLVPCTLRMDICIVRSVVELLHGARHGCPPTDNPT